MIDEFQDIAGGDLPVLQETLSHSELGRVILTGTPKLVDNHLEAMFQQSTACEWTMSCENCQQGVTISERTLGVSGLICPRCQLLVDPRQGEWRARHPNAAWGSGYWIRHPMLPCFHYHDILAQAADLRSCQIQKRMPRPADDVGRTRDHARTGRGLLQPPPDGRKLRGFAAAMARPIAGGNRLGRRRGGTDLGDDRLHAFR